MNDDDDFDDDGGEGLCVALLCCVCLEPFPRNPSGDPAAASPSLALLSTVRTFGLGNLALNDNPIYLVIAQNNANCSSYSFVLPRGEREQKGWRGVSMA